jgi:hypothetical protein
MWRNRNKFPFKTKGKGRSLMVDTVSVEEWMKENKDKVTSGRNRPRKPMTKKKASATKKAAAKTATKAVAKKKKKVTRKKKKTGKVGRPRKKLAAKKPGRRPGRPPKKKVHTRKGAGSCTIVVNGQFDLETLQAFVSDVKHGCNVHVSPTKEGYALTAIKP